MADRSIVIRIGANVTGLTAGLRTAKQAASDFTGKTLDGVQRNQQAVSTLSTSVGVVGVALTGLAAVAVRSFANFDQAMSNVAATGDDARGSIDGLRAAALKAGADTVFSATEAADAVTTLAKAGVSAADVLKGGLRGSLDLAAAGTLDVADAAEIAATTLNQFELGGNKASHVADVLAAAAGKAMGEVSDMAGALKFVGPVAHQMGVSLEETAGTIAYLAQQGILGEQAGTSLRGMLTALTSPSKIAATAMSDLGINVYDAQGQFVGLRGIAEQLKSTMGGLTNAERDQALGRIFGNEQITTARLLYQGGAAAIDEWTAAVNDQGYAAEVAATKMDNLKGDLEQLRGSLETALIGVGEGANGPLRSLVQGLTDVVNGFGELPGPVQQASLAIIGGSGLVLLGIAGMGKLLIAVADVRAAMETLKLSTSDVKGKMLGLGAVAATLTVATVLYKMADAAQSASISTEELQNRLTALESGAAGVDAIFSDIGQGWADKMSGLGLGADIGAGSTEEFRHSLQALHDEVDAGFLSDLVETTRDIIGADGGLRQFGIRLRSVGDELGSLAASDLPSATAQFNKMVSAAGGGEDAIKLLLDEMPGYRDALYAVASAQGVTLDDTTLLTAATGELALGQEDAAATATVLADQISYAGVSTEEATKALDDWRAMVAESDASFISLTDGYQAVIDKNMAWAESSADATKTAKDDWTDFYDGVSVSADDFIAQLQAQVDAQNAWEANMTALTTKAREGMTAEMATAADEMITELYNLGPEGAAQVALMASMTDEQFQKVVTLWGQKGTEATGAFVAGAESLAAPVIEVTADMDPAYSKVTAFINTVNGMRIGLNAAGQQVTFSTGRGVPQGRAGGGPITGPGTSTSDSVLVAASNGEHMLTASEVGALGGQSAVYRMRAAIRAGQLRGFAGGGAIQGYATGGQVMAQRQYVGASSSMAATQGPPAPGFVYEHHGDLVAADPNALKDAIGSDMSWRMATGVPS